MNTITFNTLSAEQIAKCDALMGELRGLMPQTDALSGDDRRSIRKLDIRAKNFVRDAINWSKDVPELAVPYVNVPDMEKSLEFHDQMVRLGAALESLTKYVNDLALLSGSQVEGKARACYLGFKNATRHRVNGASTAYTMLKTRYRGATKKGSAETFQKSAANPSN